jgi:hypothetical protein
MAPSRVFRYSAYGFLQRRLVYGSALLTQRVECGSRVVVGGVEAIFADHTEGQRYPLRPAFVEYPS